jgi:hypothetical protein
VIIKEQKKKLYLNWDSSVGIVTKLRVGWFNIRIPTGVRDLSSKPSRLALWPSSGCLCPFPV